MEWKEGKNDYVIPLFIPVLQVTRERGERAEKIYNSKGNRDNDTKV
jgi:predicted RNA-binding protein